MAVQTFIYGEGKSAVEYDGCVLDTYEHNGAWDSDFYAVCWDREKREVVRVMYDTTRQGSSGWAKIDATEEVLREMYRHYRQVTRRDFDSILNQRQAKTYDKGDNVVVIKGRKIPKGTVGKVFWKGSSFNPYSRQYEERVGIEVDGSRKFLSAEYVENADWEKRLLRGKERKMEIRRLVMNRIPAHFRHVFDDFNA